MRHAPAAIAALLLLATAPASAQNQHQPSTSQNQSQAVQNQGQQPANAREVAPTAPVATENGVTKPQGPVSGPTSQGTRGKSQ